MNGVTVVDAPAGANNEGEDATEAGAGEGAKGAAGTEAVQDDADATAGAGTRILVGATITPPPTG